MQLLPISESRVLRDKRLGRIKKKVSAQLEANLAYITGSHGSTKPRSSERLYRRSETRAEVEIPTARHGESLIFAAVPSEGESIDDALRLALAELQDWLLTGRLDAALLDGPAVLLGASGEKNTTCEAQPPAQSN